jgi:hypothetical protein
MQPCTGLAVAEKELFDQLRNVSHHGFASGPPLQSPATRLGVCDRSLRPPQQRPIPRSFPLSHPRREFRRSRFRGGRYPPLCTSTPPMGFTKSGRLAFHTNLRAKCLLCNPVRPLFDRPMPSSREGAVINLFGSPASGLSMVYPKGGNRNLSSRTGACGHSLPSQAPGT